jgi:hypothetical protein
MLLHLAGVTLIRRQPDDGASTPPLTYGALGLRTQSREGRGDGMVFEGGFRADAVADDRVLVELERVERLARAHARQLPTWLRLTKMPVGLLIAVLRHCWEGLRRIVNGPLRVLAAPREPGRRSGIEWRPSLTPT